MNILARSFLSISLWLSLLSFLIGCSGKIIPITHESSLLSEIAHTGDSIILFSAFGKQNDSFRGTVSLIADSGNPNTYTVQHGSYRVARVFPGSQIIAIEATIGPLGFAKRKRWNIKPIVMQANAINYLGEFRISKSRSGNDYNLDVLNDKPRVVEQFSILYPDLNHQFETYDNFPVIRGQSRLLKETLVSLISPDTEGGTVSANIAGSDFASPTLENKRANQGKNPIINSKKLSPPSNGTTIIFYSQSPTNTRDCEILTDRFSEAHSLKGKRFVYFKTRDSESAFDINCGNAYTRSYLRTEKNRIMVFRLELRGESIIIERDKSGLAAINL